MQSSGVASHRADKSRGMRQSEGFLKKIDLFASTPEILYRGSTSCGSNFGGLVSLIWGTLYLLVTFFVTWRYIDRGQPQSNSSNFYMKDPEGFRLDNDTLPFALGLQNSSGLHFIDPRIYNITATHHKWSKYNDEKGKLITKRVNTNLSLIPCNQLSLDQSAFANLDLSSMLCLENLKTKQHDLQITGLFESSVYGYISFRISRCRGPTCKPDAEIEATLKNCFFAVNYRTFEMRTSEFNDPIAPIPASFYTATSTTFSKQVTLRMANNQLVTENSFIPYATPSNRSFVSVYSWTIELAETHQSPQDQDYILSCKIRMDPTLITTNRIYRSLVQHIAEFGGLSQILAALGFLLTNRYRHLFLKFDFARYVLNRAPHLKTPSANQDAQFGLSVQNVVARNSDSRLFVSGSPGQSNKIKPKSIIKNALVLNPKPEAKIHGEAREPPHVERLELVSKPQHVPSLDSLLSDEKLPAPKVSEQMNVKSESRIRIGSEVRTVEGLNKFHLGEVELESPGLRTDRSNRTLWSPHKKSKATEHQTENHSAESWKLYSNSDQIAPRTQSSRDMGVYMEKEMEIKKKINSVSELDMIGYSIWPRLVGSNKRDCIKYAQGSRLVETYDMVVLTEAVQSIEKMKNLLLSAEQLEVFQMIPLEGFQTPASIQGLNTGSSQLNKRVEFFTDHQDVQENARFSMCLEKIKQKGEKDSIDNKLLKFWSRIED